MDIKKIYMVYFSPSGTTKKIVRKIGENIKSDEKIELNILKNPIKNEIILDEKDLLIIGVPVFVGRIPKICPDIIKKIKGNNTNAVVVNVYGNRDYDDALVELYDIVESNNFNIIGAGAFIAQHSRFNEVAKNRPDIKDEEKIIEFSKKIIGNLDKKDLKLKIRGNRPYKDIKILGLNPTGDENCTNCNACVRICPTNAISIKDPRITDNEKCISCMACVYSCAYNSRKLHIDKFSEISNKFYEKNKSRKEADIFI